MASATSLISSNLWANKTNATPLLLSSTIVVSSSISLAPLIKSTLSSVFKSLIPKIGSNIRSESRWESKDEVGESEQDTFQDLSIYGIIAQIVSAKKWGK